MIAVTFASGQLLALAEATPAEEFSFRPAPGVRSTSEVYMHVAVGNYWLLAQSGVKHGGAHWPNEIPPDAENKVAAKAEVVRWLKDSLAAVRAFHAVSRFLPALCSYGFRFTTKSTWVWLLLRRGSVGFGPPGRESGLDIRSSGV